MGIGQEVRQLERLATLRDSGALSDEEFNEKRRALLSPGTAQAERFHLSRTVVIAVVAVLLAVIAGVTTDIALRSNKACSTASSGTGCISAPAGLSAKQLPFGVGAGKDFPHNTATSGGAAAAVAWAKSFLPKGSRQSMAAEYDEWCLAFVVNAYGATSSSHKPGSEQPGSFYMYAIDAAHDLAISRGSVTTAPVGALIFFRADRSNGNAGHVGISLGNGRMISGLSTVTITNVTTSLYWSTLYYGWGWPASTWGPLARQVIASHPVAVKSTPKNASNPKPPAQSGHSTKLASGVHPGAGSTGLQPAGASTVLQPVAGNNAVQPAVDNSVLAGAGGTLTVGGTPQASTPKTSPATESTSAASNPLSTQSAPTLVAPNRFAVTSYNEMKGGAPHSGLTGYWYQDFTASSNTITYIGVTWGNGYYAGGKPVSGATTRIELCTSIGKETAAGVACNGMLSSKTANVINEGNTAIDIGNVAVTKGARYWVVVYQPTLSAGSWACYWWGPGTTVESSTVMQMLIKGYNR